MVIAIKKILVWVVLSLILTGCTQEEDYSIYPDHFAEILKTYDLEEIDREKSLESEIIYRCYVTSDQTYYFITSTFGYEEDMLIGIEMTSKSVIAVDILFENESLKYGEYVTEEWFTSRFIMPLTGKMKLVKKEKLEDNEVIAITGATITSKGVLDAVNDCIDKMEDLK